MYGGKKCFDNKMLQTKNIKTNWAWAQRSRDTVHLWEYAYMWGLWPASTITHMYEFHGWEQGASYRMALSADVHTQVTIVTTRWQWNWTSSIKTWCSNGCIGIYKWVRPITSISQLGLSTSTWGCLKWGTISSPTYRQYLEGNPNYFLN